MIEDDDGVSTAVTAARIVKFGIDQLACIDEDSTTIVGVYALSDRYRQGIAAMHRAVAAGTIAWLDTSINNSDMDWIVVVNSVLAS